MDLVLNEIEINNFLSYKHAKFENLNDYNVLIGKNSSGKSNLFKIFEMLRINYTKSDFKIDYLFEANEDLQADIILTFKLSKTFRKRLFENLYNGNFLLNAFVASENKTGHLKRPEWSKKDIAINWLLKQGYYKKAQVKISYVRELKRIILADISLLHQNLEKSQLIISSRYNKSFENLILNYDKLGNLKNPFSLFFTDFQHTQDGFKHNTIRTVFERTNITKHPILGPISEQLSKFFFMAIHHIPDKRKFDSESDRGNIYQTELNSNGSNLVKFIHKKIVLNEKEWIDQFNRELKYFLPDIEELGQNINASNDWTMLILKENGLDMELKVENMGSGILNIALFIAYIMELGKDKILCIEEPELYLHPGLETKLKEKILEVSEDIQIFITTHSREFLDDNEEKCSIHLIHKEANQSDVNLIPKDRFEEIYNELDIDIEKYKSQKAIIHNESFWNRFIQKVINRTEDQLWDCKETLGMWFGEPKNKEIKQVEFCEKVASFANTDGGVILLGLTDQIPRKVKGVEDLENKIKSIKVTLQKYINTSNSFTVPKEVLVKDSEGIDQHCLILAIAQTKNPIEVRGLDRKYSYPIRLGTGLEKVDKTKIQLAKTEIIHDNFDFLLSLQEFVKS